MKKMKLVWKMTHRWKVRYLLIFLILVLLLSAYLLQLLEAEEEIRQNVKLRELTQRIRGNISAEAYAELVGFLGVDPDRGREGFVSFDAKTQNWTRHSAQAFLSSYYYSFSLATTVGYGDFYPRTVGGRLLSIFVILVTLPVMIIVYNRVAEKIFKVVMNFLLTQTTQFKAVLRLYDADKSGHLDADEMLLAFDKLGVEVTQEDVEYIIKLYDKNNDGKLDTAEFADAATSLKVKIGPLAREDFKLRFAIVAFLVFALIHTILMWATVQFSWKDSLWFTVVTVSTVGLGEKHISADFCETLKLAKIVFYRGCCASS